MRRVLKVQNCFVNLLLLFAVFFYDPSRYFRFDHAGPAGPRVYDFFFAITVSGFVFAC